MRNIINTKFLLITSSIAIAGMNSFKLNAAKRPNILIIVTDQQRWDALNASGVNPVIYTPNLDRLVQEGCYFSQAVSPCPVSGPARTAMLTGRFVEKTGIRTNMDCNKDLLNNYPSYDELLVENGYKAQYYGKFHSPKSLASVYTNPPEKDLSVTETISNWERLYRLYLKNEVEPRPLKPEQVYDNSFYNGTPYTPTPMDSRYDKLKSGTLTIEEKSMKGISQPDHHGILDLQDNFTITAVQGKQVIQAIQDLQQQNFVITCSFHSPHAPMLPTSTYASIYKPENMPIPVSIKDSMIGNPYQKANGRLKKKEYADPYKIQYMTAEYYALVTEIDKWVGEILTTLDNCNLTNNTLVVFVSDHGEMLGAHGMREKNIFLEESVRVPLIFRYPGKIKAGRRIETPVSTINIFSTILDYAGISAESDGFSLRNLMEGKKPKYDFAISEWMWEKQTVPNLMIRTAKWKLLMSKDADSKSIDALYDLENDPYEMKNLLAIPQDKYIRIAEKLKENLVDYLSEKDYPGIKHIKNKKIENSLQNSRHSNFFN